MSVENPENNAAQETVSIFANLCVLIVFSYRAEHFDTKFMEVIVNFRYVY